MEISERERHQEVLLTLKNLGDLSCNPAPYNISIIPCPLPTEIVEGEHYVTADLLNLLSGSSSPAKELETEATGRELVICTQPGQPFSTSEDSGLAPQASRRGERGSRLEHPHLARKGSSLTPPSIEEKEGDVRETKGSWSRSRRLCPLGSPHIQSSPELGRRRRGGRNV